MMRGVPKALLSERKNNIVESGGGKEMHGFRSGSENLGLAKY
jgi:hypothetical protein